MIWLGGREMELHDGVMGLSWMGGRGNTVLKGRKPGGMGFVRIKYFFVFCLEIVS